MTTKIIVILGASIVAVAGMYIFGKCADKGDADAKEGMNSSSRHDAA